MGRNKYKTFPGDYLYSKVGSGWIIFILHCADNTFFVGMTRNMKRTLAEINVMNKGIYFSKHPERLPVKIVFQESRLKFREAYAKYRYMREMNRKMRLRLIAKKVWPMSGPLLEYIITAPLEDLES